MPRQHARAGALIGVLAVAVAVQPGPAGGATPITFENGVATVTGDAVQLYRRKLPVNYGTILTQKEIAAIEKPGTIDFHGDPAGNSSWKKGRKGQKDADEVKLRVDAIHLNAEGHYPQACTWLAALFGTDVTKLTYAPENLAPEKAKLMRTCAAEAVATLAR